MSFEDELGKPWRPKEASRSQIIEELIQAEITAHDLKRKIADLRKLVFIEVMTPAPVDDVPPPHPPQPAPGRAYDARPFRGTPEPGSSMEIATKIVRDHAGPITIAALAELGGLTERQARGCISALLRGGIVERTEEGYALVNGTGE